MAGFRHWAADALDLPPDVVMNVPRVELVGSLQVRITNHRGVSRFGPRLVVVRLPGEGTMAVVEGRDLVIGHINRDELLITGAIRHLRFEGPGL